MPAEGELPIDSETPAPEVPKFVRNRTELGKLLGGYDEKTISRWKKLEGCPGETADNRYDVAAWQAWVKTKGFRAPQHSDTGLMKQDIETRTAMLRQRREEIELAELEGKMLTIDEAVSVLSGLFGTFVNQLRTLRHDIAPNVVGETVPEATVRLGNAHDELLSRLSLADLGKKKVFWRTASSKLCALQQKLLPSTGL